MNLVPPHPAPDVEATIDRLKAAGEPFAVAIVVRTVAATAAKAGARAVIAADGEIVAGWVGGACARGAVKKAGARAIARGEPAFLSIRPRDLLDDAAAEGVAVAASTCPSRGSLDLFIEPYTRPPRIAVLGESPVAETLAAIAPRFGYAVAAAPSPGAFTVVATQGRGDMGALRAALSIEAPYRAFVGSRAKWATLATRLGEEGFPADRLEGVHAPAGLDVGAVTPEEIALSILAEITTIRRRGGARHGATGEPDTPCEAAAEGR